MKHFNSSHLLILLGTDCFIVNSTRTSVVQTESDFLSADSVSAGANVVKNGSQYPDDMFSPSVKQRQVKGAKSRYFRQFQH